jgi:response regulator NasT
MSRKLKILVADDEPNMREYLRELLPRLGHEVVVAESGRQLLELSLSAEPDLVITDIRMGDLDGLEAAAQINQQRPVPVILVSAYHDPDLRSWAVQEHLMAYLVKPVKQADLETAIGLAMMRFDQFQALRKETADLRQALEERKMIERAKGIIMKRLDVGEDDAFRRLRKLASNGNQRLADAARTVMAAEEVFGGMDQPPDEYPLPLGRERRGM